MELPDMELFADLIRLTSHRFNIISKMSLHFFSKEHFQRINYPKHKSLLFYLIQVLFEEVFLVDIGDGEHDQPSPAELLLNIKRLINNVEEFPNMKSLPMLWAFETLIIVHQMIAKYAQILEKLSLESPSEDIPAVAVTVEDILENPFNLAIVTKVLYYFGFQIQGSLERHHESFSNKDRNDCRSLIREAMNCFNFTISCEETKSWMEFHQLYLGFLLGKQETLKVCVCIVFHSFLTTILNKLCFIDRRFNF